MFGRNSGLLSRVVFGLVSGIAAMGAHAAAEDVPIYPQKPVTFVVPSPAGGTTDVVARIVGKKLSELLGQPFIIENRAGANGYIGTSAVLRAPKDGYTFVVMSGSLHTFTPSMVERMPFDPIEDFSLVSRLISYPFVLVTGMGTPYQDVGRLVQIGKSDKGALSYGSYGVGSSPHLITELMKMKTGMDANHIPYKGGGQSSADLIGGQISFMFSSLPAASSQIRHGKVRALAMTSAQRDPAFPDVPALAETIPGFEADSWLGLGAAKGTPKYATDKLRSALLTAAKDPVFRKRLQDLGANITIDESAEPFYKFLLAEKQKWDAVVLNAKIPKQSQ
jgi:tripartite-type tricarboxylate transporter receptor subunit TctC